MMRWVIGVMALLALLGAGAVGYSFHAYQQPRALGEPREVMIEAGTGTRAIIAQLQAEGMMPPFWKIALPMLVYGEEKSLKAGEYRFEGIASPREILQKIAKGDVIIRKITLPEGWTSRQIREALLAEPALVGELPTTLQEGTLLPETYHFRRGETRASVVEQMQQAMNVTITELWPKRKANLPISGIAEALILASIVERETGIDGERGKVAAVFLNRLRIGMRLQSDPTAMYGQTQREGAIPTAADMDRDHPWNTYTRDGLPPTPICNPGRAAIEAVLNPPEFDALYFVAIGTGGHYFAKTLDEHNRNVARYRAALRLQRQAQ